MTIARYGFPAAWAWTVQAPIWRLARAAFAAQEYRFLVIERLDRCRDDMGLGRQHRPLQVQLDHGIRCRNVQGLESLPGTIRHQRTVAIQIFLKCFAVHD